VNGFFQHLGISLRLHFRNRMALLYGYLFPLLFLAAFWVLYRHEKIPLLRHMGELLTVSILGGACFGLPTTIVSERERGVWRRYRLLPVPTWALVASTVVARYLIVLSAGLLQLGVAFAVGMTAPAHPLALALAFTVVSFAFIGLGLVIAMLADTVPAVQALGQCIFLPMLIIGGVAVRLASLPEWAQHVSAFFPGRYAVESLQSAMTGDGVAEASFGLLALILIGMAACVTATKLFRWEAQSRRIVQTGRGWILFVLAAWCAVGLLAEWRAHNARVEAIPAGMTAAPGPSAPPWARITANDVVHLDFNVPPDDGVVAPIDSPGQAEDYMARQVDRIRRGLPDWGPGRVGDDVQRVRNLLCVAALPDVAQMPVERYVPLVVLHHLSAMYPKDKLIRLLTWIVLHPDEDGVIRDLADLGLPDAAAGPNEVRERVSIYATKFIARLTGRSAG
jgi:ABC-2 type transport system permease protein